jgi:hypothetical protein
MSVVRVDKEIYEKIKLLAEKTNREIKDIVDEALRLYVLGSAPDSGKEITEIKSDIITLQYERRCYKCGKQLNIGDLAYWIRYTYSDNTKRSLYYCLECYYQSAGLKNLYLTKKKFEIIIRSLRAEADELSKKVLQLRTEVKLYDLKSELYRLYKDLIQHIADPDLKNKLIEISDKLSDLDKKINDLIEDLKIIPMIKTKKTKVISYEDRS